MRTACMVCMAGALVVWGSPAQAQDTRGTKPDNTKVNQRDRNKAEPTADQQKETKGDRELAANIRRAIVKDKTLSMYAHNVKVIVKGGMVTLKGPVRSDEERKAVETLAASAAGGASIANAITVAPGDTADRKKMPDEKPTPVADTRDKARKSDKKKDK